VIRRHQSRITEESFFRENYRILIGESLFLFNMGISASTDGSAAVLQAARSSLLAGKPLDASDITVRITVGGFFYY